MVVDGGVCLENEGKNDEFKDRTRQSNDFDVFIPNEFVQSISKPI